MRICLGILRADAGEIRWDGTPDRRLPRRTWGYLPEERGLYPRMTVLDQLVYFASLYGEPPDVARREARALARRGSGSRSSPTGAPRSCRKGNQQKVQFIAAILHDPEVLLMDEPFTGLDPVNLALLREAFLELRDRGRTLVFSTHQMEAAEALCESVAIVDRGRVVAGGTLARVEAGQRAADGPARRRGRGRRRPGSATCPGSRRVRPGAGRRRARARARRRAGGDPRGGVGRGAAVTRFEVAEPSLEAVFIERVGRPADDDEATPGAPSAPRRDRLAGRRARPDGPPRPAPARTPGSSPGASTATASAARSSWSRRSC